MKKKVTIGISAVVPATAGMILSFLLLFIGFYTDEMRMKILMETRNGFARLLPFLLPILSGILFILAEIITGRFLSRRNILSKKETSTALLIGAVIYVPLTAGFLEYSLNFKFMDRYMPARELVPQIMMALFYLASIAAAVICGIYHIVVLVRTKKSSD